MDEDVTSASEPLIYQYQKPLELFKTKPYVTICAPMVRYSKLPFRTLVRQYNCDLTFTPMIVSDSFLKSEKARNSEFSTNETDRPLIVQFAASNPIDLADASEVIYPYCDGIDLNCGCPQRWAIQEGIGACLINKPELMADILQQTRNRISDPSFTVSTKIRIHHDLRKTVDLCQKVEKTGVSWIAVHGRTIEQRNQPVNTEAIKIIKESVSIPVIANGDIKRVEDAERVHKETGVNGVMSARGILANPAMFAGYQETPLECVQQWVEISLSLGTSFQIFHHTLMFMLENIMSKAERRIFNSLHSTTAVVNYLQENYEV